LHKALHCYSYVIYGREEKYFQPIFESYSALRDFNVDFSLVVFCDDLKFFQNKFRELPKIHLFEIPRSLRSLPRLARFLAANFVDAEYYHFRDSDSILARIELLIADLEAAIDGEAFLIRNHPLHFAPILAGLFSLRRQHALHLSAIVYRRRVSNGPYYDQIFLSKFFYDYLRPFIRCYSSSLFFLGESRVKIAFNEDVFCGMPVDYVRMGSRVDSKFYLVPFFSGFHRLFQSTRFMYVFKNIFYYLGLRG
jgi:hypothetical protein